MRTRGAGSGRAGGSDRALVFAVTTGRSGSTLLSNMLNQHDEILSISELMSWLNPGAFPAGIIGGDDFLTLLTRQRLPAALLLRHRLDPPGEFLYPLDGGGRFDRQTVPSISVITLPHISSNPDELYDEVVAFARSQSPAPVADHYRSLFKWLRERAGRRVTVERSGMSTMWLADLVAHFPEARFVHIYRDGRDCAISMRRHNSFRIVALFKTLENATGVNLLEAEAIPPAPPSLGPELRKYWPDRLDADAFNRYQLSLETCAHTWSKSTLAGLRLLRRVAPDRLHALAYEDLLAEPHRILTDLARFLDVEADRGWIERSAALAAPRPPAYLSLTPHEQSQLDSACRMAMNKLYGERWPAARGELSAQTTQTGGIQYET
jgi:hypothetical protein